MLKVILRYEDCLQDGRNVMKILTENKIQILRTRHALFTILNKEIICLFNNYEELTKVLYACSINCSYEVTVRKVIKLKR